MLIVIGDLETMGLKPSPDSILMSSFVVEDTEHPEVPVEDLPHFTCFIRHPEIRGEAFALAMNGWILDYISKRKEPAPYPIYTSYLATDNDKNQLYWAAKARDFLHEHFGNNTRITVGGKNFASFDMKFLPEELQKCFRHKVIDPAILYVDWTKDDQLPGLEECKRRAGINTPVAHDAREDALDVIRLIRFDIQRRKNGKP